MAKNFLDNAGLSYLWTKIKALLATKADRDAIPETLDEIGDGENCKQLYGATAASSDGIAYTATINGITELYKGLAMIIIPSRVSASTTPTLNVNSLGAKGIRRRLSNLATSTQTGYANTWIAANKAFLVVYDGTYWIVEGLTKPAAADLYGTLAVEKGGTGATTAAGALTKLGAASATDLATLQATVEQLQTDLAAVKTALQEI